MKNIKFLIFLLMLTISTSFIVSGQKADFSGTWNLNQAKSTVLEGLPTLIKITINIKGDSLLTERIYQGGDGQEYPFNEKVTLDGKESTMTIYEMPRKLKAVLSEQDGSLFFESTTTINGENGSEDFTSKETWIVDKPNNSLTMNFKNIISAGESSGVFIFNKAEPVK